MQTVVQGSSYGQLPRHGPRVINVRLAGSDFFNAVTGEPNTNYIPSIDGYNVNFDASIGVIFGTAERFGYNGSIAKIDLTQQMGAVGMSWIASVYIDNSLGIGVCIVRNPSTGVQVICPPATQGHFPMLLSSGSNFTFEVAYVDPYRAQQNVGIPSFALYPDTSADFSGAGGKIAGAAVESGFLRLQFTDVIVPPCSWSSRNLNTGRYTDFEYLIVAADTWELALNGNAFRKKLVVSNQGIDAVGAPIPGPAPVKIGLPQEGGVLNLNTVFTLESGAEIIFDSDCMYVGPVWLNAGIIGQQFGIMEM